jgi:predicted O-methyltransferase YrrM
VPLPQSIRSAVPNGVRDQPALRAVALTLGLIPPRPMHSPAEADLLARLAGPAERVVEIGVYEGSSAVVLCRAMVPSAELHLIDPFVDESGAALPPNWSAAPAATRMSVWRVSRHNGPKTRWHIARSQDVGRHWNGGEVDFVFIDGDHSAQACREDWDVWNPHIRPGGAVAFHDARLDQPNGTGSPGPTAVVDEVFRSPAPPDGWSIANEIDTLVVVRRDAQPSTPA